MRHGASVFFLIVSVGVATYTDIINFVETKPDQQAGPEWLDTNGKGAGWHEGYHFGLLATAALAELFDILKSGGKSPEPCRRCH